jgi:hypothetical protein
MTNSIALTRAVAPIVTLADIPRYHAALAPDAVALSFEGRERWEMFGDVINVADYK